MAGASGGPHCTGHPDRWTATKAITTRGARAYVTSSRLAKARGQGRLASDMLTFAAEGLDEHLAQLREARR